MQEETNPLRADKKICKWRRMLASRGFGPRAPSYMLRIHVYSGHGDPPYDPTIQRVPEWWKRGPIVNVPNAEVMDLNRPTASQSQSKFVALAK